MGSTRGIHGGGNAWEREGRCSEERVTCMDVGSGDLGSDKIDDKINRLPLPVKLTLLTNRSQTTTRDII
jgi:hypothetical protein